jgi:Uma2 family endonuclease
MRQESHRHYSLDEYFAVEEMSEIKHEYFCGDIFAMAGASLAHNRIVSNLFRVIAAAMPSRGRETFGSDLRVETPGGLYTYPDVSVVCGGPNLVERRPDTVTNPILLIEVLSDATRDYDRGQKIRTLQGDNGIA